MADAWWIAHKFIEFSATISLIEFIEHWIHSTIFVCVSFDLGYTTMSIFIFIFWILNFFWCFFDLDKIPNMEKKEKKKTPKNETKPAQGNLVTVKQKRKHRNLSGEWNLNSCLAFGTSNSMCWHSVSWMIFIQCFSIWYQITNMWQMHIILWNLFFYLNFYFSTFTNIYDNRWWINMMFD